MKQREQIKITPNPREPGDLCGSREAADILGFAKERTRIARWQRTGKMPEPVALLAMGPVWLRADVEKLAEREAAKKEAKAAA